MSGPEYRTVTCPECNGSGEKGNCSWCGGAGEVTNTNPDGPPYLECRKCNGTGVEPGTCQYCYGKGTVEERVD